MMVSDSIRCQPSESVPASAAVVGPHAGDNAAMESFFSLLQNNVLNRRRWTTREDSRIAIVTWIEIVLSVSGCTELGPHFRRRLGSPRAIATHPGGRVPQPCREFP